MAGVATAHEQLLQDSSIQFHPEPVTHAPPPVHAPAPAFEFGDGSALFWTVITIVGIAALLVMVRHLRLRRPPGTPTPTQAAPAIPPVILPLSALQDADALAAAGQYGEAVHALLLRGVDAIQRAFPGSLAPSATSRDIAGLPALPPSTRHAFAGIAERTERAVFARKPLRSEDWDACRTLYAGLLGRSARTAPP